MHVSLLLLALIAVPAAGDSGGWASLAPGLDLGTFASGKPAPVGDSQVTVLRIDPNLWDLEFVGLSQTGEHKGRTAKQWCQKYHLTAGINAGMFGTDLKTHVGYLESHGHVNNDHVNGYQSVAAFDPLEGRKLARFRIFDLDDPGVTMEGILEDYASAVQNLRLVKRPGLNRWSQKEERWSEAALGEDAEGRLLFIFSRSPFTMHDLNRELLSMDIGLVAAQHLEGGPEAQLYMHHGDQELEMFGSYETSFRENDGNTEPWPIPNVLGIRRR
jgi:hypothetical protein